MVKRAERAKQQNDADQSVLSHRWLRHRRADLVAFTPRGTDQITPLVAKDSVIGSRGVGKRVGGEGGGGGGAIDGFAIDVRT